MTTVDPQQFGEMVSAVKANSEAVKDLKGHMEKHAVKMEEGFDKVHKRIDDHMEQEEEERKEMMASILAMRDDYKFFKKLIPLLGFLWPVITPFLSKIAELAFFEQAADTVVAFFQ